MENKKKNKKVNGVIYIIGLIMLVGVVAVAMVTANKTTDIKEKVIVSEEEDKSKDKSSSKGEDEPGTSSDSLSETEQQSENNNGGKATQTAAPTEFCLPVTGYISKEYSMDMPVFSLTMNDYRTHSGVDIQASVGSAVAAIAEGTVSNRYTDPFMGNCVEVTHGGGLVSRYMNLGEQFPEDAGVGAKVYCGQTIACVGDSAAVEAADTSHLHFELIKDSKHVDPIDYIGYLPMEDEGEE